MTAPTPHRAASAKERDRLDAVVGRLMDLANAACQKGETAYTCGLTARSIAEDVRDIRRDLAPLLDRITAAETDLLALARMYGEACGDLIQEAADSRQLACSYDDAYDLAAAMKADRDRFADEVALLHGALTEIAKGETMAFDEGLGFEVSFWLDEEEMSEIARRALTATGGPTDDQA